MECNNKHCMWNAFSQCCPEDEEQWNNAVPNTLDCPSSLRRDFQQQLGEISGECVDLLYRRNMRELIEIRNFIVAQREGK